MIPTFNPLAEIRPIPQEEEQSEGKLHKATKVFKEVAESQEVSERKPTVKQRKRVTTYQPQQYGNPLHQPKEKAPLDKTPIFEPQEEIKGMEIKEEATPNKTWEKVKKIGLFVLLALVPLLAVAFVLYGHFKETKTLN